MDENLPDGTSGNEVTVEWEEDHIVSYTIPKVYALKRPTWEINPTKTIENFKVELYKNSSCQNKIIEPCETYNSS